MDVDEYVLSVLITSIPYNGIDLMNLNGGDLQKYTAVVTMILSAIMLVVAFIPESKIIGISSGIIVLVLAIIILISAVAFVLWAGYYSNMDALKTGTIVSLNIGFYLCAGAGALGLLGGLIKTVRGA